MNITSNNWVSFVPVKWQFRMALPATLAILLFWRWLLPQRDLAEAGLWAVSDSLFGLCFTLLFLLICVAFGRRLLLFFPSNNSFPGIEKTVIAFALGAGISSALIFGVGGLLGTQWTWLMLLLFLIAFVSGDGLQTLWDDLSRFSLHQAVAGLTGARMWLVVFAAAILLTCLIRVMAPPWDPDGLIYHLQAPKLFLEMGRIGSIPGNAPANYPMAGEMLFLPGMALGSDITARLIHLVFMVLCLIATFCVAKRYFSNTVAWLSLAILLGIPILPFWGTLAYTDFAWALFTFLSFAVVLIWSEEQGDDLLLLGGLLTAFAVGSKYLALGAALPLGIWIVWKSRNRGLVRVLINLGFFTVPILLIAFPWYAKNWLAFGNPIYPLTLGVLSGSPEQQIWNAYMRSGYGTGRTVVDYLLLPVNLYLRHDLFSTVGGSIELPSLFFPVSLLAIRNWRARAVLPLILFGCVNFGIWAAGAQQIRLLLPIIPILAILSAFGLEIAGKWFSSLRIRRILAVGLLGGMVAATLVYQLIDTLASKPWQPVLGLTSEKQFLENIVTDYGALEFVTENVDTTDRVLMIWDGRGYYCDSRCLPDTLHAQWTAMTEGNPPAQELAARLVASHVVYLLVSQSDAAFLLHKDPQGRQQAAWNYLGETFLPECGNPVYEDVNTTLWRITCR